MKKFCKILLILGVLVILFTACSAEREQYIRIHIRANSDEALDQEVKLEVRDAIVNFLAPLARTSKDKNNMMQQITENIEKIEAEAEKTLSANNMDYHAKVQLGREMFPTKTYGELTLKAGEYDALIIKLGTGEGSNWWCVAFPPLCFVPANSEGDKVVYKSKIVEWISKIF